MANVSINLQPIDIPDEKVYNDKFYSLQKSEHYDTFCSTTISWKNTLLRYFQTFSCLYTAVCIFLVPYLYFFSETYVIDHIITLADMIYLLVMVFRARTSHMKDGVEEQNLLKIRDQYQGSIAFVLDIVTFLPLLQNRIPVLRDNREIYILNRQTMIIRLHYILHYLDIREQESGTSTLVYRTTKYILLSSLVIHFSACGWYGLACRRNEFTEFSLRQCIGRSWIIFLPQNILQRVLQGTNGSSPEAVEEVSFLYNTYVTSLYWSAATVTSTGYGDVRAYTIPEKVFSVFVMIIGLAVLYGMTMGGMTSMLTNIDAARAAFVHRYKAFEKEVNRMGVPNEIKDMCLSYFDCLWRRWKGEDVYYSGFLNVLPPTHRANFATERFELFFDKMDILDDTEEAFIRNLAMRAKPTIYLKNQFVHRSGEYIEFVFFLHHGILEVLDDAEDVVVAVISPGKVLGQIMLFYDLPRINSVRCKSNCDILLLEKQDFRNVLALYPDSAAVVIEAVKKKCTFPNRVWPTSVLDDDELDKCLNNTESVQNLRHNISSKATLSKSSKVINFKRLTTIHYNNYTAIELSRVPLFSSYEDSSATELVEVKADQKPSFVEFILDENLKEVRDHPEVLAYESDKGFGEEETSWIQRLNDFTVINPEGRFFKYWLDFMFVVSLIAGLFTTFIAFFTTVPGQQTLYTFTGNDDLFGRTILDMATDTCNTTQNEIYYKCPPWPFNDTVECIKDSGGSFAWRILGNAVEGYQVRLPARYDINRAVYGTTSGESQTYYFISLFFIDIPCYLNIILNFRVGVVKEHGLETRFGDIISKYNRWNGFWLDAFGVFPFEFLAGFFGCSRLVFYHSIAFLRLNRVVYFLFYIPASFSRWEYRLNVKITTIRTIKVLVYIYSITHVCACCFYFWSCSYVSQRFVEDIRHKCKFGTWAWVFDIDYFTSAGEDYIKTMYWATTTMTSTGYGDITASTTPGRVLALSTMIVGTIMYGWLVAVIASTISNNETALVKFRISMLDLKNYLTLHGVPSNLIQRIINVRQLEWEHYAGTAVPGETKIGRELSKDLQDALAYESMSKFIECVPFFFGVDPSFVSQLCNEAVIFHYTEGDIVIYEGDLSKNLYIIKRGHCDVVTADLKTKLEHLAPGDYFGECELLFGCGSPRTVACETACEIIVLSREIFDQVLMRFPVIKEQLERVENDDKYKDRVLQAIKLSNVGFPDIDRGSMSKKYYIETIEENLQIYTDRKRDSSGIIFLTKEERRIRVGFFGKLFYFFLLPISFDPLSKSYVFYESIRTFLIINTLIIVPLQFAFLPANYVLLILQYSLDLLSIIDQYVKAHTAYYNHRAVLVTHPIRTALHYIRTSFMLDLISWFPFEAIIFNRITGEVIEQQWRLVAILRFNRILQLYKVHGYFAYSLSKIREINRWIIHFRNLLYGFLLHHWMACIMFVLACPPVTSNQERFFLQTAFISPLTATGSNSYCHNSTWIGNIAFTNSFPSLDIIGSVVDQYILSFYWATATLVCVGYGDIHAYTPVEMFVVTFIMIGGTVFYSFILGGISASLQTDDIRRGKYREKIDDIKKFFIVYNISSHTEKQVLNYYYYLWNRTGGVSPDKLFIGLPPSIQTCVCQCIYGPMLREAFHDENSNKELHGFYRLLSTRIVPYLYLKGSIICRQNDIGNEMFFVQRGLVAVLDNDDNNVIKMLGPGQHFGEVALLFTVPRNRTIKAVTNCELNVLSKTSLDSILERFPQFRQKMIAIAEERKLRDQDSEPYSTEVSEYNASHSSLEFGTTKRFRNKSKHSENDTWLKRIIHKDSQFLVVWHNVIAILSFLSACICIYQVAFFNHNIIFYFIGYLIDMIFLFDMIIAFNTSVFDLFSGNIDDPKTVNLAYAKTLDCFLLDSVSNAPIEILAFLMTSSVTSRLFLFSCGRLNRLLRLYRLLRIFRDWEKDIRLNAFFIRLYYALLSLTFTIHCIACGWYAIACPNSVCADPSWTTVIDSGYFDSRIFGYNLLPWVDSVYWTVATMTSTGYGDIKPETKGEMLYASAVMVLGKVMIGYILGITAATLANDESLTVWYKQNVNAVKRCMGDHDFDKKSFEHIVRYYEYLWQKNQGINTLNLFPDLSFSLRADIASQVCGHIVQSIELFKDCPDNFLRHVCMAMVPSAYMPGDYICFEGDVLAEMYTIYRGTATAERNVDGVKVQFHDVKQGDNFLCESLLTPIRRPCSLVARTYIDAFTMTLDGLLDILQYHPQVTERIIKNGKRLYPDLHV